MAKQQKPKKDPYAVYKALTNYLVNGDERLLRFICKDKKKATSLRGRVVTYFMGMPKFLWYVNKYMNNLYDHNKWSNEEWFKMFHQLCIMYGVTSTNQLFFAKYQTNEYADFAKLIREYYKQGDSNIPSSGDIQALYALVQAGIITPVELEDIELLATGKESGGKKKNTPTTAFHMPKVVSQADFTTSNKTFDDLSPAMQTFVNQVKKYVKSHSGCQGCPLRSHTPVILDTNLDKPGPVDVAIIGLNPDNDDLKHGITYTGPGGRIFRGTFDKILHAYKIKYVMLNSILCSTPNEKDLDKPAQIIKKCAGHVKLIREQFPSKLTVVMGDKAMKAVGVKGAITKNNGKLVDGYFVMIHPNAVQHGQKNQERFDFAMAELAKLIEGEVGKAANEASASFDTSKIRIPADAIVDRLSARMTLFDIRQFGEQIVYIMKDEDGKKKYHFEDISIPIFIKGGQYSECPNITSVVEQSVLLSAKQKEILTKRLYHNMKALIDY